MISRKDFFLAAGIIAVLIVGGITLGAYVAMKENVARADQVKQDVQDQIKTLQTELNKSLAQIAQDKKQVKTPQEIVRMIPRYVTLPSLPRLGDSPTDIGQRDGQNAPMVSGANAPDKQPSQALPDAPSASQGLYFPPEDVKPLFDHLADCKANELKLGECQAEIPLLTKRAEAAEKAMKGGGFWHKLKSNGKWFFIGAAAGGATAAILKH